MSTLDDYMDVMNFMDDELVVDCVNYLNVVNLMDDEDDCVDFVDMV